MGEEELKSAGLEMVLAGLDAVKELFKKEEPKGIIGTVNVKFDVVPEGREKKLHAQVLYYHEADQYGTTKWCTNSDKSYFLEYDSARRVWNRVRPDL